MYLEELTGSITPENLVSAGCLIQMTIGRAKAYKTNPESVRIL